MMELYQRQQEPKTRNTQVSRTSCALHTCLYSFLPLLFFTTLIIAGTIALSYSLFLKQPVPRQFVVAITITFAALISMAVALHIAKALRDKRAHEIKEDIEERLPEHYGPPRTSRLSHLFPSDVEVVPNINDTQRPPTIYLPDGLGATTEAAQHNPDLELPAEPVTHESFRPPTKLSTSEHGRERDVPKISAVPSTTIKLTHGHEQKPRTNPSHPDAPKRTDHSDPSCLTAQQLQDIPLVDLIPRGLQIRSLTSSDPSGHQAQRARPGRRSARVRRKGTANLGATIKVDRPWYEVQPVPL